MKTMKKILILMLGILTIINCSAGTKKVTLITMK